MMMGILGILFGCKGKEKATEQQNGGDVGTIVEKKELPTMPEGRLLRVTYFYQGMMMEELGNFNLHREAVGKTAVLSFRHYGDEVSCEVSDTLFDAARRIIEDEKMYEYAPSYTLNMKERILDGYSWGFDADFEGDEHIASGGSNVSPRGDGLNKIRNLLYEAARRAVETDQK